MRFAPIGRVAVALMATMTAAAMPACSGARDKNAPLIAAMGSPIADVPIPAGFSMKGDSTSKVVQSSGLRFVDHKYDGRDDLMPVVRFYRDQMPTKGWTFVSQNQLIGNEISLHYTKNSEDCVVTVTPGSFHTHVRVQIDPAGRNAAK